MAMVVIVATTGAAMPQLPSPASGQSDSSSLERQFIERLSASFRGANWQVVQESSAEEADLVLEHGRRRYVAEVKVAREPRKLEVQGAFADAILQANAYARAVAGAKPLAVVGAPHISDGMAELVRDYARKYGDGCAHGLIDSRGRFELHGAGLDGIGASSNAIVSPRSPSLTASTRADLFSDLGQWLLKVLLARRLPEKFISAPRLPIRNAMHLAELAGVSVPHASRQVAQLRRDGFLDQSSELRLVRVGDLLDQWRAANRRLSLDIAARWLFPAKAPFDHLKQVLRRWSEERVARELVPVPPVWRRGTKRMSLALFAACEALGLGFVSGAPMHVYAEDVSAKAFEDLGLVGAKPGERVDVFVRQPKNAESIFRAGVWSKGLLSADALQCWLDVADHPARGEEQARQIWNRVLKPHLLED
jgi:hypothetical protein